MIRALFASCLLLILAATPAAAWYVTVGAGESDVGLHEKGTGYMIGIGETWPAASGPFDVSAELAYVQRAGSQPMYFTDQITTLGDAKVRLDMVRPALFGGLRPMDGNVVPRVYAGFSVPVKMGESWDKPDGETNRVYGYEDVDVELHAGLSVGVGRFFVDLRYNHGLLEQLVDRDADNAGPWLKAEGDLEGVETPVDGAKVSSWQVGVGFEF